MNRSDYNTFTRQLVQNLQQNERVLGLIAAGSMAQKSHQPDHWSDHDFLVIVQSGEQESFRQNLQWMPEPEKIIFAHRDTEHGLKVFYEYGHLTEFAIFDSVELHVMKVNDYRILIDRDSTITSAVRGIKRKTTLHSAPPADHFLFGQLIAHVFVGAGRYARGEKFSAHAFIKGYALNDILSLFAKHLDAPNKTRLDNLDPLRRFEVVYPDLAAEIHQILMQDTLTTGRQFLQLSERHFHTMPEFPTATYAMVYRYLDNLFSV